MAALLVVHAKNYLNEAKLSTSHSIVVMSVPGSSKCTAFRSVTPQANAGESVEAQQPANRVRPITYAEPVACSSSSDHREDHRDMPSQKKRPSRQLADTAGCRFLDLRHLDTPPLLLAIGYSAPELQVNFGRYLTCATPAEKQKHSQRQSSRLHHCIQLSLAPPCSPTLCDSARRWARCPGPASLRREVMGELGCDHLGSFTRTLQC